MADPADRQRLLERLDVALTMARSPSRPPNDFREVLVDWLEEVREEILRSWPPECDRDRLTNLVVLVQVDFHDEPDQAEACRAFFDALAKIIGP